MLIWLYNFNCNNKITKSTKPLSNRLLILIHYLLPLAPPFYGVFVQFGDTDLSERNISSKNLTAKLYKQPTYLFSY